MTIDELIETAMTWLSERGELLDVDLYRLVKHDKAMFRQLRKKLIARGFVEDDSGTGLKATKRVPQKRSDSDNQHRDFQHFDNALQPVQNEEDAEFNWPTSFSEADFLPSRHEKPKVTPPSPPVPQSQPVLQEPDEAPALVTLDLTPDGLPFVSRLFGSKLTLLAMVLVMILLAGAVVPWQSPPDARSVYHEFNQYFDHANELRSRAVSDPDEWRRATSHSRSRVQRIVKSLKDVRTGASARQPAMQELLWAGNESLLKLLESREIDRKDEEKLKKQFEFHMAEARRLLDGGTRNVPEKKILPPDTPGAGKPYLGK